MAVRLAIDAQTNELEILTIQNKGKLVFRSLSYLTRDHLNATMHEGALGH